MLLGHRQQFVTVRRQRDATGGALKQSKSELMLELPDQHAQARWGDEKSFGGARETLVLGDEMKRQDAKVAGLVYVAAFAPDTGESVASLIQNPPPGAPVPPILAPQEGFLFLDKAKFAASFAADVEADAAAFMADSQMPWGVEALTGAISQPAWRAKPSWYVVAGADKMIPPDAQRAMAKRAGSTVTEVAGGSHAVYVSQPEAVAAVIEQAAAGASAAK
jgi:pimeloyl-ACP methyl ester carboxylesterase